MGEDRPNHVVKTAIFGGCVSRDTLAFAGDDLYPLSRYIARHSLLSSGSDAAPNFPPFSLPSKFQQRMIEFDIRGDMRADISKLTEIDIFLWDLNVERTGCWQFPDGSIVTNSPDLRKVPELKKALEKARKIDFASEEHLLRWKKAATTFVATLQEFGIKDRTLVLAPDWALEDNEGNPTRKLGTIEPVDAPSAFSPYLEHLEELGLEIARFSGLISDLNHKWGRAPFHYTADAYTQFRAAIDNFFIERS